MDVQKTITLNIKKQGKNFIVKDATTLQIICGTSAVNGNLHMFNIIKRRNEWVVPIKTIKDRIYYMEEKSRTMLDRLKIMKQIVRDEK